MILKDEAAVRRLGARLAKRIRGGDVITLSGALGVGKTTLARGLIAGLGHRGEVPSPSFAIVQPYEALQPPLWHVDLYRIEHPSELDELGLDSIGDEAAMIIEWPERAGPDRWRDALALSLLVEPDGARRLTAQVPAAWEGRWP